MSVNAINSQLLKKMVINGAINLKNQHKEVDALNVFPVPDGDTGTNMQMTMMSGVSEISKTDVDSVKYVNIGAEKNTLSSDPSKYVRRERFYGEIKRSFYIGMKKDTDLKAKYIDGILTITFPKADIPKKETKNITIS